MDCEHFDILIHEFLDGEISAEDEGVLFTHLARCGQCRVSLQQYSKILASANPELLPYPESLDARVMSSLIQKQVKETPVKTRSLYPAKYLYAAVVIILSLSGLIMYQAGRVETALQGNAIYLQQVHSNFENQQHQLDYLLRTVPPVTVKGYVNRSEQIKSQL